MNSVFIIQKVNKRIQAYKLSILKADGKIYDLTFNTGCMIFLKIQSKYYLFLFLLRTFIASRRLRQRVAAKFNKQKI